MNTADKLVFMHVPKTAGTTIHNILVNKFDQSEICPERFNRLDRYGQDEMQEWKYYSGHFNYSFVERIPGQKQLITVLREPNSRIVSLYNYWKSHRDDHIAKHNLVGPPIAKKLSLEEFVTSDIAELANNVDNVYTRIFSGYRGVKKIQLLSESKQNELLSEALENLEKFDFVGCLENPNRSIKALLKHLDFSVPDEIPKDNSIGAKKLPPHLEKIENATLKDVSVQSIETLTYLDQKIYQLYSESNVN